MQSALVEIKKKYNGKNINHYKRLLVITKPERRKFIENMANNISQIIEEFPLLLDYEMVINQFLFILFYYIIISMSL